MIYDPETNLSREKEKKEDTSTVEGKNPEVFSWKKTCEVASVTATRQRGLMPSYLTGFCCLIKRVRQRKRLKGSLASRKNIITVPETEETVKVSQDRPFPQSSKHTQQV